VLALFRHPRRVGHLFRVIVLYALLPRVGIGPYARHEGPVRLRLALERLGGAWLKLGQMLSMRMDILPARYCTELFGLLNRVEPFSYETVRGILRDELGDEPERIFAEFAKESFAAASIGQVHRARLRSGEAVAVKVQRPGVREALRADIELMYAVSGLLDLTGVFGATPSRDVIDEFARWTADELDYLVEARQAVLLREHARGEPRERVARVYRSYTTSRVLTTELIEGIPLIDIVVAARDGDEDFLASLPERGHDIDRIVRNLDWNMLNEVYVFGYFHADLHPANLFVLPGDVIGYVDFGIVGQLPDRIRESLTRYGWQLFRGDVEAATDELMRWVAPGPSTDVARARWELVRCHQQFLYETAPKSATDAEGDDTIPGPVERANPYLRLAVAVMETVRRHQLTLAASVVAYLRMLVTLGMVRHQLRPEYDVVGTARRFFTRLMRRRAMGWLDPRSGLDHLHGVSARVGRAVDFLEFLEGQQPLIASTTTSLLGVRERVRAARQGLVRLAMATLLVGAVLYLVLADPRGTRAILPGWLAYDVVHVGLLVVLVLLIFRLVLILRRSSGPW
jgi:predicted unusual protein kinase regulating ubiquinone biosynthesis (AarF/ABC1/UbiB family)